MDRCLEFMDVFPLMVQSILYGSVIVLTIVAVHLLRTRKRANMKLNITFIVILFLLDTIHISLAYAIGFLGLSSDHQAPVVMSEFLQHLDPFRAFNVMPWQRNNTVQLVTAFRITFLLISATADAILIYRTYIIWEKRKRILIPLVMLYLITLASAASLFPVTGSVSYAYFVEYIFAGTTSTINLLCTGLIAGRLWWLRKKVFHILGRQACRRYASMIVILIESGALYPISMIINSIWSAFQVGDEVDKMYYISLLVMCQSVCIAPALILVRVGLGISSEEIELSLAKVTQDSPEDATHMDSIIDIQGTTPSIHRRSESI